MSFSLSATRISTLASQKQLLPLLFSLTGYLSVLVLAAMTVDTMEFVSLTLGCSMCN